MYYYKCMYGMQFCDKQWRHSVKIRLYNTPPPYFILWNAVTSVKARLYKNPPPYFIVLVSSVKTKEVEVIEFHRICIHPFQ